MKTNLINATKKALAARESVRHLDTTEAGSFLGYVYNYTVRSTLEEKGDWKSSDYRRHSDAEDKCWEAFKKEVGEKEALRVFWLYAKTQPDYAYGMCDPDGGDGYDDE